jgi:protein tyrosine/serine phosphatase
VRDDDPHVAIDRNVLSALPRTLLRKWLAALILFLGIVPVSYGLVVWEQGNFHVVSDGRAYRSRQLAPDELAHYALDYGIRSVLNLRGKNLRAAWYQEEIRAAESLGLRHYDYGISANRDVADQDIERIVDILREAPKPILIHCRSGADRTSLVAALYLYRMECRSPDEAERQLSIRYGHFPFFGNSTIAMDRAFQRYVHTHAICAGP